MQYTGSKYYGEYVNGRMEGKGHYIFPPLFGTEYFGQFKDGMCHGQGQMRSENATLNGDFEKGVCKKVGILFPDGAELFLMDEEGRCDYCSVDDRRFFSEIKDGLSPAGREKIKDKLPVEALPRDMYDCGDGFYNPITRIVYNYNMEYLRNADDVEHKWIVTHCRKGWDEPVGKKI